MIDKRQPRYIPALGLRVLTPLYDHVMQWSMREAEFKKQLIAQARLEPGQQVLDVGCGTGTLALMIKQAQPRALVVGLDGDPAILAIAREKSGRAGLDIRFEHGQANALPYPDGAFERVFSSLVFHHLTAEDKQLALKEVYRVLRPGGELHFADFGRPLGLYSQLAAYFMRWMERVDENVKGLIPEFLRRAGFQEITETASFTTLFGTLTLIRARKE